MVFKNILKGDLAFVLEEEVVNFDGGDKNTYLVIQYEGKKQLIKEDTFNMFFKKFLE